MLPPGQRAIDAFPRFGTHFHHAPPTIPAEPTLEIGGAVSEPFALPLAELRTMPRREIVADFHCVAGWSVEGLRWEGVPFAELHRDVLARRATATVTHVRFVGLDGHWSVALLEDVLHDDVLLAEQLNGQPLGPDHGAPLRLISPGQYGFINTKHLCRIELLAGEPASCVGSASAEAHLGLRLFGYKRFVRARVWREERHRFLPPLLVREISRWLIPGIRRLSARRWQTPGDLPPSRCGIRQSDGLPARSARRQPDHSHDRRLAGRVQVTISDTSPADDPYDLVLVEVLAA
jgi:DMSO/TMAO reductase YedYZ molybdopterin-dependent catalytic subunit